MRAMIGCAGMIAAVGFFIVGIISLFVPGGTIGERLLVAAAAAATVFVAAILLLARDHMRHAAALRRVRRMLLAREDANGRDFASRFAYLDAELVAQTRDAVSAFFGVPAAKLRHTDRLRSDLQIDAFEPTFHSFVVYSILAARSIAPQPFTFCTAELTDVGDLANEVQRVLDDIARSVPKQDRRQ